MSAHNIPTEDNLNARYDPMTRDELIAECERLRAESAERLNSFHTSMELSVESNEEVKRLRRNLEIQTVNATAVLDAQRERDLWKARSYCRQELLHAILRTGRLEDHPIRAEVEETADWEPKS